MLLLDIKTLGLTSNLSQRGIFSGFIPNMFLEEIKYEAV